MNDDRGGEDVASVEEVKWGQMQGKYTKLMILSVGFMHILFQVTMFMTFLKMRTKLLPKIQFFGSTLMEWFGKEGSLKFLTLNWHRVPTI